MGRDPKSLSPPEAELALSWVEYLLDSTKMETLAGSLNSLWKGDTKLGQPDISKWRAKPSRIPRERLPHLSHLVEHRVSENLRCDAGQGPVYLCNLHPPYTAGRAKESERRLMELLRVQLPRQISGLALFFYRTRLANGTGAQCLANRLEKPNVFFLLIEAELDSTTPLSFADLTVGEQNLAAKEIRAHVFTNRHSPTARTILE